jgi:methylmalonyl-CoA/ethylmalonyl-CoA epimerase
VGFAVADLEKAASFFRDVLGASLTEPVVDPIQKVQIRFARFEGGTVELVAPAGEGSPVDKVLARGGGCYHLCFETPDIDAALGGLRQKQCLPTGPAVPAVAFGGRRVCFLYHREGRLIELVEASAI